MKPLMKAAVVHAFGQPLRIEEVPVPTPGPGQILVNIKATGVCHTDLHAADGDWPVKPTLPFIPGHEGVGFVAAVGAGVKHVREGDRVGVPWLYTACGHCEYCHSGWETLCHDQQNTGYSVNGSYAEYVLADPDYVGHLPDQVAFDEIAPILCAGVTVYKGIRVTDTRPGQWIAISGIGGLGHVAVQYARAMGLHVAAIDVSPDKLALAKQLGAQLTIDASTVALNGLPPGDFPLPIFSTVLNGITVRGSIVGTRRDLQESLDFAADGLVRAHIHRDRLENINDVFAKLRAGKVEGRVVLTDIG